MSSQVHPLCKQVLAALQSLRHQAGLRTLPLLDNPTLRWALLPHNPNPSADELVIALQDRLQANIERLRPERDENLKQRDWLRYYLLHYHHDLAAVRAQMDKVAFEAAWAQGQAMAVGNWEQLIAYVESDVD